MFQRKSFNHFRNQKLIDYLWRLLNTGQLKAALAVTLDKLYHMKGLTPEVLADHDYMLNVALPSVSSIRLTHYWHLIADYYSYMHKLQMDPNVEYVLPEPGDESQFAVCVNNNVLGILLYAEDLCHEYTIRKLKRAHMTTDKKINDFYIKNTFDKQFKDWR